MFLAALHPLGLDTRSHNAFLLLDTFSGILKTCEF